MCYCLYLYSEDDFGTTVLWRKVALNSGEASYEFSINIILNDNYLEATEYFLLYLDVSDNSIMIERQCALAGIAPNNRPGIQGMENRST